jgi:outer membrane protein assembly factor BamB
VVHNFGGSDTGDASIMDAAGNLLIGGASQPPSNLAFARFRPDGSLDLSQIRDLSALDDHAWGIAIPRPGKFLLAGSTDGPGALKAVLALYNSDGSQSCGVVVNPVSVFAATASGDSGSGRVTLHWLNPSYGPYDRTVIRRDTAGCPATHNDGVPVVVQSDGIGAAGSFLDTVPLGATYHYAAFVLDSTGQPSVRACASAAPFDRASGNVDWKYDTAISALATPGLRLDASLGESVLYVVSNDGVVHAVRGGTSANGGGSWPSGYRPFRIGGSAQARPPIVPIPPSSRLAAILGSQDGHVYAVDALTGELIWKSPKLGTTIQAAPAVVLSAWGGGADLVFAGTRLAGQPNRFYALHPDDGTVAWVFDNGGGANGIGMMVGGASVHYASRKVYFTSAQGASGNTTWCLDYTSSPPVACWASFGVRPLLGGDIEAGAVLHQGSLYVSDTTPGNLIAVNSADGSGALFYPLGGGGAKGFVFPEFGTPNLFASTSSVTMSVRSGALNWQGSCIANPSTAIAAPFTDSVFVGSNEGKLFELSASTGSGCPTPASTCIGDCVSTIVGPPAYDVLKGMLYAGTDEGVIHAVRDTP